MGVPLKSPKYNLSGIEDAKPSKYNLSGIDDAEVDVAPEPVPEEIRRTGMGILPGQEISAQRTTGPLTDEERLSALRTLRGIEQPEPFYQPEISTAPTEGMYAGKPAPIPVERVPAMVGKAIDETIANQPITRAVKTAINYPKKIADFLNNPYAFQPGEVLQMITDPLEVALGVGVSATPTGAAFQSGMEGLKEVAPETAEHVERSISPLRTLYGESDFGKAYPQLLDLGDTAFQLTVFKLAHLAASGKIKLAPKEKTALENIVRTEVTRNYPPEDVARLIAAAEAGERLTVEQQDLLNAIQTISGGKLTLGELFLKEGAKRGIKYGKVFDVTPIERAAAKYERLPNDKLGPEGVREILRAKPEEKAVGVSFMDDLKKELPIDRGTQSAGTRPIPPDGQEIIDEIAKKSPTNAAIIKSKIETGRYDDLTPAERNLIDIADKAIKKAKPVKVTPAKSEEEAIVPSEETVLGAPVKQSIELDIHTIGKQGRAELLETYRESHIVKLANGAIAIYDPKDKTLFQVALDDTKMHGPKHYVPDANTVENARKYIDYHLEATEGKLYAKDAVEPEDQITQAKALLEEKGSLSTQSIQRKLKVGYSAASRILQQLTDEGFVDVKGNKLELSKEGKKLRKPLEDALIAKGEDPAFVRKIGDAELDKLAKQKGVGITAPKGTGPDDKDIVDPGTRATLLSLADQGKLPLDQKVKLAGELGKEAFEQGGSRAPAQHKDIMRLIDRKGKIGKGGSTEIFRAYIDAWDKANLAAPVPGEEAPADNRDSVSQEMFEKPWEELDADEKQIVRDQMEREPEKPAKPTEIGKDIQVERSQDVSEGLGHNQGVSGTSLFFATPGDAAGEFGEHTIPATIKKTAKLFKGVSSREYIEKYGLRDTPNPLPTSFFKYKTIGEAIDAYDEESLAGDDLHYFRAIQKVAEDNLKKHGFDGAEWTHEDNLVPHQFQIWNKSVVTTEKPTAKPPDILGALMGKSENLGEYPYVVEAGGKSYPVASFEEASKKWEMFRDKGGYGATKLADAGVSPLIKDDQGNVVGHIAYNGRIYEGKPEDWTNKTKLLYDNRKEKKPVTPQLEKPAYDVSGIEDKPKKAEIVQPDKFYTWKPTGFEAVNGRKITIKGWESEDFFVYQRTDKNLLPEQRYSVVQGVTGEYVGFGKTSQEAQANAAQMLERYKDKYNEIVKKAVGKQGMSPRYGGGGMRTADDGYYFVRVRDGKVGKVLGFLSGGGEINPLKVHASRVKPENLQSVLKAIKDEGYIPDEEWIEYNKKQVPTPGEKPSVKPGNDLAPTIEQIRNAYPLASGFVDGREVLDEVPNTDSISATLQDYEELTGIREVPMSEFELTGKTYSATENEKIRKLAAQIKGSGKIAPLIVVVDPEGPWILEGSHRADALKLLKAESFPALVVIDTKSFEIAGKPGKENLTPGKNVTTLGTSEGAQDESTSGVGAVTGSDVESTSGLDEGERAGTTERPVSKPTPEETSGRKGASGGRSSGKAKKPSGRPSTGDGDTKSDLSNVRDGDPGQPPENSPPPTHPQDRPVGGRGLQPRDEDRNHVVGKSDEIVPAGEVSRIRANINAIKLLKELEEEKRNPTPEEKKTLAQYVGWGGLPNVFNDAVANMRDKKGRTGYYGLTTEQESQLDNWEKKFGKYYDELQKLLSDDEYYLAKTSTINAHYTSREIIENGLWPIVKRLGFTKGKALEPSAGIGHIIGLMPEDIRDKTQWRAVELDSLTGRLLSKLYPQARVQVIGFENSQIGNNTQDLSISNVPFAASGPKDGRYPGFSLHNYFLARMVDATKPGGIVVAITSNSTMDNAISAQAREWLAGKADLVGAIRLPNDAFKKNAGTEVTTDILIFRKKTAVPYSDPQSFRGTVEIKSPKGEPITINEYFAKHPEMMLGYMSLEGKMYREGMPALMPHKGQELVPQLVEAVKKLPENIISTSQDAPEQKGDLAESSAEEKDGGFYRDGNQLYQVQEGKRVPVSGSKIAQVDSYIKTREAVSGLIEQQLDPSAEEGEIAQLREKLNKLYDAHVKKHGHFSSRSHNFMEDDPSYALLRSIEDIKTVPVEVTIKSGPNKGKVRTQYERRYSKGDIFTKRTIFPREEPSGADNITDAISISMSYRNAIDPDYIAKLLKIPSDDIRQRLIDGGHAFENPATGGFEPPEQYLTGFVHRKLREAEIAAKDDSRYERNVEELQRVQPPPVPFEDIGFRLGSRYIPPKAVEAYVHDRMQVNNMNLVYLPALGKWVAEKGWGVHGVANIRTWGASGMGGSELLMQALNQQRPTIYIPDPFDPKKRVKDVQGTAAAQAMQEKIQDDFIAYIKAEKNWHSPIAEMYNDLTNGLVEPHWKGPEWEYYPGMSHAMKPRQHQKDTATRALNASMGIFHAVGTGKTLIAQIVAMEARRLGTAKKPMLVAQNATVSQIAASFKKVYPAAKILSPSESERTAPERQRLLSRIATGDWDAVIIPQSFAAMIPDNADRAKAYINEEIAMLEKMKQEAGGDRDANTPTVKQIAKAIKKLKDELDELSHRKVDAGLTFEQLGVDMLIVDEAHAYKKLGFVTGMENIKGIDTGRSQRAFSMHLKARHIQEKSNGKNVVFMTGTPITNTVAEAWTMLRYLRPDILREFGIENFDQFATMFGEVVNDLEFTAVGKYKVVSRFAKYNNGPELVRMFRTMADVVTSEDLNLPGVPKLRGGKPEMVEIKQHPELKAYMEQLRATLEAWEELPGKEKMLQRHIPLVIFGLAKKAAIDMRLVDPSNPDHPQSKTNAAVENIFNEWKNSGDIKGVQLAFADMYQSPEAKERWLDEDETIPNPAYGKGRFNLYQDIKEKLIKRGVPAKEILIVAELKTAAQREKAFEATNAGEYRILLGSSDKMGVGVNVQERAVGVQHIDAPLRPMDLEQRIGRVVRQGNMNAEVFDRRYGVERSIDANAFQRLATKNKFIRQILSGKARGRTFDDPTDEVQVSLGQMTAMLTGDPRAMERFALDTKYKQLSMLREEHEYKQKEIAHEASNLKEHTIPRLKEALVHDKPLINELMEKFPKGTITDVVINGTRYEGDQALEAIRDHLTVEIQKGKKVWLDGKVDSFRFTTPLVGFTMKGVPVGLVGEISTSFDKKEFFVKWSAVKGKRGINLLDGEISTNAGFAHSFRAAMGRLEYHIPEMEKDVKNYEQRVTELEEEGKKPFDREKEYHDVGKQLAEITFEVKKSGEDKPDETKPDETKPPEDDGTDDDGGGTLPFALGPGLDPETVTAIAGDVSNIFNKVKNSELRKRVHDFITVDPIPALSRHPVAGDAAVEHASAKLAAPFIVDDLLSKVFPYEYDNPEAMSRTIDILNKDNILAGYEEMQQREQDARNNDDEKLAEKWAEAAEKIAEKHDLDSYETEVQDAQSDPIINANIERWKEHVNPILNELYNVVKGVDPETERAGRGKYFDARINLLPGNKAEDWGRMMRDDRIPIPSPSASSYRNPNAKHDPFDRAAKFTGEYSTNARLALLAVLGPRYNEATKIRFYNALVAAGVAVKGGKGVEMPEKIQGKDVTRLAVKMPHTSAEGHTRMVEEVLYVRKDLVREIRSVLGTDMPPPQNPVFKILTGIQLAQIADAVTHAKNIQTTVARAQGAGSAWKDVIRKFPFLGTADAIRRIISVHREVIADTPAIRAEIAEMAKQGLIRPLYPPSGIQKFTHGQEFLHKADSASRVIMNRFFDNLLERGLVKDTPANRRRFINQVGQYNARLMGPVMQIMRNIGVSPFVVAGRNYNRQGRWGLTGNPGVEAAGPGAAAQLRLTNLLGVALLFTVPMMLNMLTSGSPTGREGTPLGAWDMGDDPKTGKRRVFDLLQITGLRRGLRLTGVEPLIEGVRADQTANQIAGKAIEGVGQGALHPWLGPAVGFVSKMLTGRQLDMRGQLEAVQLPEGGMRQYVENFRAALDAQNPLIYSMVRPAFEKIGLETPESKGYLEDVSTTFLSSPYGAIGVKKINPTEKGWELAMRDILKSKGDFHTQPEERELRAKRKEFVTRFKLGRLTDEDKAAADEAGLITPQLIDQFLYTPQALSFGRLRVKDAVTVYNLMNAKTQNEYYPLLETKILNSREFKEFIKEDQP